MKAWTRRLNSLGTSSINQERHVAIKTAVIVKNWRSLTHTQYTRFVSIPQLLLVSMNLPNILDMISFIYQTVCYVRTTLIVIPQQKRYVGFINIFKYQEMKSSIRQGQKNAVAILLTKRNMSVWYKRALMLHSMKYDILCTSTENMKGLWYVVEIEGNLRPTLFSCSQNVPNNKSLLVVFCKNQLEK